MQLGNEYWGYTVLNEENSSGTLTRTYVGRSAHIDGSDARTESTAIETSPDFSLPPFPFSKEKGGDGTANMYFAPYRFYNPAVARWITPDPLGMVDGPNLYGYVAGNPFIFTDSMGLDIDIGDVDNSPCQVHCLCFFHECACVRVDYTNDSCDADIGSWYLADWPDRPVQFGIIDRITVTCEWWDSWYPPRSPYDDLGPV